MGWFQMLSSAGTTPGGCEEELLYKRQASTIYPM